MLPRKPPVPVKATYHLATNRLQVRFDRPLRTGATAAANWHGHITFGNGLPTHKNINGSAPGTVAGTIVHVPMARSGTTGGNIIDYFATPADLVGKPDLVPVAPFANFPLTVV